MAEQIGLAVEWYPPVAGGRDQTYRRDFELVSHADRVEVFFSADHVMEGGTAHVVEAAQMRNIPVYAWAIDTQGRLERVGEDEQAGLMTG